MVVETFPFFVITRRRAFSRGIRVTHFSFSWPNWVARLQRVMLGDAS
jgi:hypothetical protein